MVGKWGGEGRHSLAGWGGGGHWHGRETGRVPGMRGQLEGCSESLKRRAL